MKITLTKKDKVLIGITILLYVLGFFIGGWGLFPNLLFLFFVFSLWRKSHTKGQFSTFHLIILMVVIGLSILIKVGFFLDYFQNYSIKKKFEEQIVKNDDISALPTTTQQLEIVDNNIIWKKYSNPIMKVSFEYPSQLLIGEDFVQDTNTNYYRKIYIGNEKSQIAVPTDDGIYAPFEIDFYSNDKLIEYALGKPLNEAIIEFKQSIINSFKPNPQEDFFETNNILVDGQPAIRYSGIYTEYFAMDNKFHETIFIQDKKGVYLINNNFIVQDQYFSHYTLNKIISSFKFEEKILKQESTPKTETGNSTLLQSYSIPKLNLSFELPTKLSGCGNFTFFVEDNRSISGEFPTIPCSYDLNINSYSVKDKTKLGSFDVFMNIQGYVKRINDYFYIRYQDGQIKETIIPKEANPEEIQSDNGIKMLRVKGTGNTIIQETEKQWIGGLLSTDQGVIINTGDNIFPGLTIAVNLKKTRLSEEEFLKILKSFKKN